MNLEQFLAGAVFCIAFGVLAGVIANWWSNRDDVKQMQDWEDELVKFALTTQAEASAAQKDRAEAQLMRESAKQLMSDTRRKLYQAAHDAIEFDDEMADTQLTLTPVIDVGPAEVIEDPDHPGMGYVELPDRKPFITAMENDDTVVR